jgi:hypothetical protein
VSDRMPAMSVESDAAQRRLAAAQAQRDFRITAMVQGWPPYTRNPLAAAISRALWGWL